jgi:hypothetical protein
MSLKISKLLKGISFKFRSWSLYYELKYYIKNKQSYFKGLHETDRGIGKTYNLIKLAIKYKCPIYARDSMNCNFIWSEARRVFKKDIVVYTLSKHEQTIPLCYVKEPLALIEEGIDNNLIEQKILPYYNCIVGYKNLY